ncbi:MAG: hypothetical protein KC431_19850, partial [Myxococcales bacterium]|nr:hypothetical protein [Myxococcales bacterium]
GTVEGDGNGSIDGTVDGDDGSADGDDGSDDGSEQLEPCSRIDLVFVIDNSPSMLVEHQRVVAALDPFMVALLDAMPEAEWHIGMLGSDNGKLVDHDSDLTDCFPNTTANYLTHVGEAGSGLLDQLQCALAGVGTAGNNDERPMQSVISGLSTLANAPGGPNEGFARPEAELLLVVIGDEDDDQGSPGGPNVWTVQLAELRDQGTDAISMLGILGRDVPNACPTPEAALPSLLGTNDLDDIEALAPFAQPTPRLTEVVESIDQHVLEDVCVADYGDAFAAAIDSLVAACEAAT